MTTLPEVSQFAPEKWVGKEDDPILLSFGKSSGAFPVKPSGGFFQRSSQ